MDAVDMELFRAESHLRRRAPRKDGGLDAGFACQSNPEAIARMECFEELALGPDVDAAIRQHAVNVKNEEFYARCALFRLSFRLCQ